MVLHHIVYLTNHPGMVAVLLWNSLKLWGTLDKLGPGTDNGDDLHIK